MSIVVRFKPANLTPEKYDESIRRIEGGGVGSVRTASTTTFTSGRTGSFPVSEIWDSREQLAALVRG